MAYNGSGTFVRLYNWVTDRNNSVKITASRMDAEFDGMATGLSTAITKDGQTEITANIPFNGKKITTLGDATAATDALNRQTADARYMAISTAAADLKALLDEGVHTITDVASAGTCDIGAAATDRVRITGTTTITSFGTDIDAIRFVHFADALTLTYNATSLILPTAANITTAAGDTAIFSSDASGNWRCLVYQRASGATLLTASTTVVGSVELATVAEAGTGTDTTRAVTPAGLFPDEAVVASATTTDLGAETSSRVRITGTTTITGFGTVAAGIVRNGRFSGALTLTHNGTSLILPGGANITTAANDTFEALSLGSGNWIVTTYTKADGTAVVTAAATSAASQADQETATSTTTYVSPGRQQFHPSAAKAWVRFNSAGTVAASYNIDSITDTGTGNWTVNIATDFSSGNFCGVASGGTGSGALPLIYNVDSAPAAGTYQIKAYKQADGAADDSNFIFAAFFGDQA